MSQERQGMLSCSFSASVLEIYNEQIFDLLVGGRNTGEEQACRTPTWEVCRD
jgi:hypothetical protein